MGNTNFQTIHQMGTAISNMVKQATGRDNVQNIDMEHVTVAQNHRYEEVDISGQVVSFQAGEARLPFEKLDVQINPVQDLHGYDSPWPAGGGKNKLNPLTVDENNAYIVSQTGAMSLPSASDVIWRASDYIPVTAGDVLFFGEIFATASSAGSAWYDSNKDFVSGFSATTLKENNGIMTVPNGVSYLRHSWRIDDEYNTNWETNVYITLNSNPHEFSPYSNICPITGWTMVNVYQAGQSMEDARVFRFPFPSEAGIVYGGTLDMISGELVVDMATIDMGNISWAYNSTYSFFYGNIHTGKQNSVKILCEIYKNRGINGTNTHMANAPDGSLYSRANVDGYMRIYTKDLRYSDAISYQAAMSGVQLVYELKTPVTYQLTPQEITTLLGQNTIWADTGDIEVKFTNVKELY